MNPMNIPGFSAEASLTNVVRDYSKVGVPAGLGHAGKVVPQQTFWPCVDGCQNAWSACISGCQWWEWAIGSCVPKCRVLWLDCVGRCR
jgi:hypothetical protein